MKAPIIIDCDPGHDDALAILLALASPELELVGVTTTYGNQTLEKTTMNALRVLEFVGREDVAVAPGADRPLERDLFVASYVHGESGLDGPALPPPATEALPGHAVDFLARHLRPGVVLVPTGPLTNVALLLERRPEARPDRIVLMGGSIAEGNVTPAAEFNIWADPEAAHRVFTSGLDVTMIGLDVTHRALMTTGHAEQLRASGPVGRFVAELFAFYHRFHQETYGWEGSPIHDAVAVAHVARPGLVETLRRHVAVETQSQLCRGRTVVDRWRRTGNEPNAHVGVGIDADGFVQLLLERLAGLDANPRASERRLHGVDPRLDRQARNEGVFKAVNREIERASRDVGDPDLDALCECGKEDCRAVIAITVSEYERVHGEPDRFVVLPGHETPELERVVERNDRYLVVDKTGEAEEAAAEGESLRGE